MSIFPKGRQNIKTGSDSDATGQQLFLCGQSGTKAIAGDTIEDISTARCCVSVVEHSHDLSQYRNLREVR